MLKVSTKAKAKLAAIFRLRQHLDSSNMETMYKSFVRSIIEYDNLEYMAATKTHTHSDKTPIEKSKYKQIVWGQENNKILNLYSKVD